MIQFFARVVELREGKIAFASESVKYDGKVTTDSSSREFLEVTCCLPQCGATSDHLPAANRALTCVAPSVAVVYHPTVVGLVNCCLAEN